MSVNRNRMIFLFQWGHFNTFSGSMLVASSVTMSLSFVLHFTQNWGDLGVKCRDVMVHSITPNRRFGSEDDFQHWVVAQCQLKGV